MSLDPVFVFVLVILLLEGLSAGVFIVKAWSMGIPTFRKNRSEEQDPEIREEVHKSLQRRRHRLATTTVQVMWAITLLLCIPVLADALNGKTLVKQVVVIRGIVLLMMTVLGIFQVKLITHRAVPFWHIVFMLGLTAAPYSTDDFSAAVRDEWYAVLSVVASGLCLRFRLCAATNLAMLVVVLVHVIWFDGDACDACVCIKHVVYFVAKMVLIALAESVAYGAAKREIKELSEACQQSAVMSLLERMCDAVVAIDGDLRLKAHVPKLAGLLMHTAGRSLEGDTLTSHFAEADDRDRFEEAMRQSCADNVDGLPCAGMLNVGLRDATGTAFPVVLVHIPYTSVGGRQHHLVGVREDSDEVGDAHRMPDGVLRPDIVRDLGLEPSPALAIDDVAVPQLAPSSLAGSRRSSVCSHKSATSGNSTKSSCSLGSRQPDGELVCNVLFEPGLPVWSASPGILADFGVAQVDFRHLGDRIAGGDIEIRKWLQDVLNETICGAKDWNFTMYYGKVEFRRASAAGPTVPVRRHVWVHFPKPWADERIPLMISLGRRGGAPSVADPRSLSAGCDLPPAAPPWPPAPSIAL